jgi:hypothetical protein
MKRSGSWRPSPALVIACLALFVALGGTVVAATKIDGKTIVVKSLPGNRLEVGSLPGNRVAPHSLNGSQIKAQTLSQVPDAAHAVAADSARHAETATAAGHATDATTINGHAVGCPAGRREFAGACWDTQPSAGTVTVLEATAICAAMGGELPDLLALLDFVKQPGVAATTGVEWTNSERPVGFDSWAVAVVENGVHVDVLIPSTSNHYRCVTPLLT